MLLKLDEIPKPDDAADALAIAWSAAVTYKEHQLKDVTNGRRNS